MEFLKNIFSVITTLFLLQFATGFKNDMQCAPRFFPNRSCVCVCNETYCDSISRETPVEDRAFVYTSSESGLRFEKTAYGIKYNDKVKPCLQTLDLDPLTTYQTMEGFGGAVTDAAGLNWQNLETEALKKSLIDSYCSDSGLQYNMLRVPIGGTDFSTHPYAYNELPEGDVCLSNFTLSSEDLQLKIPMIKACQKVSTTDLKLVSATWSPPSWMKTNENITGYSNLKKQYFQTYADYHCNFIKEYEKHGILIWAVSTGNEPINGVMNIAGFNTLGWNIRDMGEWIVTNLGPTMRKRCPGVKILGVDDQRFFIPLYFNWMLMFHPAALEYLDGVAVHFYADTITPASQLVDALKPYPGKFVIVTEACAGLNSGAQPDDLNKVVLGSWARAVEYVRDIIENINNNAVGWIDWNLCLNTQGGPNWADNYVDSPIIVDAEKGEFYKQPMFYAMGHFSKFVPRGSRRIKVSEMGRCGAQTPIINAAFLTPENTVVVVMYNDDNRIKPVALKLRDKWTYVLAQPQAIVTVEITLPRQHY